MNKKTTADTENRKRDKEWVSYTYFLPEFPNIGSGFGPYKFYTSRGTLIAVGYDRVVYGDHGPYIEFDPSHIVEDAWEDIIERGSYAYYDERYPKDKSDCKLYVQKRTVRGLPNPPKGKRSVNNNRIDGYADYVVGKLYISPEHIMEPQDVILMSL